MERKLLNYRVVIEKEGKLYNAYCKTLGLADYGKTINEATKRITSLIKFHIESLEEMGRPVPMEKEEVSSIVTVVQVLSSFKTKFSPI